MICIGVSFKHFFELIIKVIKRIFFLVLDSFGLLFGLSLFIRIGLVVVVRGDPIGVEEGHIIGPPLILLLVINDLEPVVLASLGLVEIVKNQLQHVIQ